MMHYTQTKNIHIHHTHINTQENQNLHKKNKKQKQKAISTKNNKKTTFILWTKNRAQVKDIEIVDRDREADTNI
jgi:hypothetical protein